MPAIGKDDFLKLSKSERITAMKNGNFVPPKEGTPERAEFNKLMFQDPAAVPPPSPEPPKAPEQPEGTKPPETPPAPHAEPPKDFGGYSSMEVLVQAHNEAKTLTQRQQSIIDKINATNGNQGRELSALKKQLEEVNKEISEHKASQPAKPAIAIPKRPNPKDFDDGILDEKYQKAYDEYAEKLEEAANAIPAVLEKNLELSQQLAGVKKDLDETKSFIQEARLSKTRSEGQMAWDELSQNLNEFQKENGITMAVPWTQINNNLLVLKDETATQEAKAAAQAWISALSPNDIESFKKLTPVVTTFADFSEGVPKPRFASMKSNAFKGYLLDNGFTFQRSQSAQSGPRPPAPSQPAPGVSPMDASASSSGEPKLADLHTGQEKQNRMRELIQMRKERRNGFADNPELLKEYNELRVFFRAAPVRA